MVELLALVDTLDEFIPFFLKFALFFALFLLFHYIFRYSRHALLLKAKTRKQISNAEMLVKILRYSVFTILIMFFVFSFSGSWTGLGLSLGLLSAALGFALQKPITGIAAWIMVVIRRPFQIGDRVIIGTVKGDILDVTLTHVYLHEIGGLNGGEEETGRTLLIPNWQLFDNTIINYSLQDDYVLGQVIATVTYESNMDKAIELCIEAAKHQTEAYLPHVKTKPYVRLVFGANGIDLLVRFFTSFSSLSKITSDITKEIYVSFNKHKDLQFAYPHTEIVYKEDHDKPFPPARKKH